MKNVENLIKEMMDLIKSTQASQIKGELHVKDVQESFEFTSAKYDEYEKDKKKKENYLHQSNGCNQ